MQAVDVGARFWLFAATAIQIVTIAGVVFNGVYFGLRFVNLAAQGFTIKETTSTSTTTNYVIGCTNASISTSPVFFQNGDTLEIAYTCAAIQDRQCVTNVCASNRQCLEVLSPGAECALDTSCRNSFGQGWACNTMNCSCYLAMDPNMTIACQSDIDCLQFEPPLGACVETYCDMTHTCNLRLIPGANCSSSDECVADFGPGYRCDLDTCGCVFQPPCDVDEDCPVVTDRACVEFVCTDGRCTEQTIPPGVCSLDEQCVAALGDFFRCDTDTCTCVAVPECTADNNCPIISDRACVVMVCNGDMRCEERLAMGASCSMDEQCAEANGFGSACNITSCECYTLPQCDMDSQCPVPENTCLSFACVGGICEEELAVGATCASDEQCVQMNGAGSACNRTACECYALPICDTDSDCPVLLNTCSSFSCIGGVCEEELAMGATCTGNEDCSPGFYCNTTTCSCVDPCDGIVCDPQGCNVRECVSGECVVTSAPIYSGCCLNQSDCTYGNFQCATFDCIFASGPGEPGVCWGTVQKGQCLTSADCLGNNTCENCGCQNPQTGELPECFEDEDCAPGTACQIAECTVAWTCAYRQVPGCCLDDGDCTGDHTCVNNTCTCATCSTVTDQFLNYTLAVSGGGCSASYSLFFTRISNIVTMQVFGGSCNGGSAGSGRQGTVTGNPDFIIAATPAGAQDYPWQVANGGTNTIGIMRLTRSGTSMAISWFASSAFGTFGTVASVNNAAVTYRAD